MSATVMLNRHLLFPSNHSALHASLILILHVFPATFHGNYAEQISAYCPEDCLMEAGLCKVEF